MRQRRGLGSEYRGNARHNRAVPTIGRPRLTFKPKYAILDLTEEEVI
jgi:hypothetical protein